MNLSDLERLWMTLKNYSTTIYRWSYIFSSAQKNLCVMFIAVELVAFGWNWSLYYQISPKNQLCVSGNLVDWLILCFWNKNLIKLQNINSFRPFFSCVYVLKASWLVDLPFSEDFFPFSEVCVANMGWSVDLGKQFSGSKFFNVCTS